MLVLMETKPHYPHTRKKCQQSQRKSGTCNKYQKNLQGKCLKQLYAISSRHKMWRLRGENGNRVGCRGRMECLEPEDRETCMHMYRIEISISMSGYVIFWFKEVILNCPQVWNESCSQILTEKFNNLMLFGFSIKYTHSTSSNPQNGGNAPKPSSED